MSNLRVLYVDDDADIRQVVQLSLELDPGFIALCCGSGSEAIDQATKWLPDIILCDVMMPKMDGREVLARLAANDKTKHIPVIFMTALAQERELDALMSLGARGVIHKPFDAGSLPQRVRQILAGTKFEGLKERLYACSERFRRRLASDKRVFASARLAFQGEVVEANELDGLHRCSHQLAGAAGVFAIQDVSTLASNLEASVVEFRTGIADRQVVTERLDLLIACIDRYRPCEAQAMPQVRWAEPKASGAIA